MISVSVKGVLIGVLLIALIVLVVFLIVMVANLTDTIKKANALIDGGTTAAGNAKAKVDDVTATVKEKTSKVREVASEGISTVAGLVERVIK
jgi:F0F1-type ATP synthase membrane subunit b/b'